MTSLSSASSVNRPAPSAQFRARATTFWSMIAIVVLALALLLRTKVAANTDVSWLLTVGERVLNGQRLYVDIIETNPPMAVLAYLPGLLIARATHLSAERVTDALVFIAILLSLALATVSLRRSSLLNGANGGLLGILALTILAIVPMQSFGQREHIALILLLPYLVVLAVRARRERPATWTTLVAGYAAGLALCFKPHFAIPMAFAGAALALHLRSWRALFLPEAAVTGLVAVSYVACMIIWIPQFFTSIGPLVRDVYLLVGLSLGELVRRPGFLIWLALFTPLLLIQLTQRRTNDSALRIILAASLGFAIVFLLQRKGWPYHSYPMIALALLGLGWWIASTQSTSLRDRTIKAVAIMIFAGAASTSLGWFNTAFDARPLQAAVARLGPHPRILALTAEPGLGHPLTRALDGAWVSRQQAIWVTGYLRHLRQRGGLDHDQAAALEHYAVREREMLAADIRMTPPTVVLVDELTSDWGTWLRANPEIDDLLKDYRLIETVDRVAVRARPN